MMKNIVEGWSRIVVSGSDAGATEMDLAKFYVTSPRNHTSKMTGIIVGIWVVPEWDMGH